MEQLPKLRALGPDTFNWLLEKGSGNRGEYEDFNDLIVSMFAEATEDLSNFAAPAVLVKIMMSHASDIAAASAKSRLERSESNSRWAQEREQAALQAAATQERGKRKAGAK